MGDGGELGEREGLLLIIADYRSSYFRLCSALKVCVPGRFLSPRSLKLITSFIFVLIKRERERHIKGILLCSRTRFLFLARGKFNRSKCR